MNKQSFISFITLFVLAFIVTSCGPSLRNIKADPIPDDVSNLPEKKTDLDKEQRHKWSHMDIMADTVPGMSVKKAYDDIIKDHEGETVIVGVVDAGVDINHEDLKDNIWTNEDEVPDNDKDDDDNGYVDDVHGWNFLDGAVHDNLEYTRLLKKLKPKFEGKDEDEISEDEQEDYELYKRAKDKYDEEKSEAQRNKLQYKQIKKQFNKALDLIDDKIEVSTYTRSDLSEMEAGSPELQQAKGMVMNLMEQADVKDSDGFEEVKDELDEAYDHYNDKLEYHLNMDYDGRDVVGDDPDDFEDRDYGDNRVDGPTEDKDDILHGTHVAGIIGAVRHNDIGINGVANNVKIMPVRAVPDGDEYDKDVALGIRYAVDNGAKVINTSFGKYFSPHPDWVTDAIKYAADHDVLIVNAAGNESNDTDDKRVYPNDQWPDHPDEISDNFLSVGALNYDYGQDLVASFSNYGKSSVDIFAPGVQIYSSAPKDEYKSLQGTSMAAPGVAGMAAVIRSYFPKLSAAEVKEAIMKSGLTTDIKVDLPKDPMASGAFDEETAERPFDELSKSGKMANLYNALIKASKM